MLKKLTLILAFLFCISTAKAQDDTITLTREEFEEIVSHLENLRQIEHAIPIIELDAVVIIQDHRGRIFAPAKITGRLNLAFLNYEFAIPLATEISRSPAPPKKVIRNRFKLMGYVESAELKLTSSRHGVAFVTEPIHYKGLGLNAFVGTSVFGAGLSADLTKNLSAVGGIGIQYGGWNTTAVFGLAFAF